MKIAVFHDDRQGTAVIVDAAVTNGLSLASKEIDEINLWPRGWRYGTGLSQPIG